MSEDDTEREPTVAEVGGPEARGYRDHLAECQAERSRLEAALDSVRQQLSECAERLLHAHGRLRAAGISLEDEA